MIKSKQISCSPSEQFTSSKINKAIAALRVLVIDQSPILGKQLVTQKRQAAEWAQRQQAVLVNRLRGLLHLRFELRAFDLLMLAEIAQWRRTTVNQVASQVLSDGTDLVDVYNSVAGEKCHAVSVRS